MNNLLDIIKKSVRKGEFNLSSGEKTNYYVNVKECLMDGDTLKSITHQTLHLVSEVDFNVVGGVVLGGIPIVSSLLSLSNKPLKGFIVRKEPKKHGTMNQIEGIVPPDSRVLLVEDVINTGESLLQAKEIIDKLAKIVAVFTVVDRSNGAITNKFPGIPVYSILQGKELCS